jgi:hypothetical protein
MSSSMAKNHHELDEPTRQIAERLLHTPPKPHSEMKIGRPKAEKGKRRKKDGGDVRGPPISVSIGAGSAGGPHVSIRACD